MTAYGTEEIRDMIDKCLDRLVWILQFLMGIIILIMTISNVIQVFTRYFVSYQLMWVEDISSMGLYWIFALGMPMAWILSAHLDMNVFERYMSDAVKQFLWFLQQLCGIVCGVFLIIIANRCIRLNRGYVMSIIGFDESMRYIPLLAAGILLLIISGLMIASRLIKKKQGGEVGV